MNKAVFQKAYKAFSISKAGKIYLRKKESENIESFVKSKSMVLYISGNPGIGKTYTVKHTLKSKILYLNYMTDSNIAIKLKKNKKKIVVIDEFDKYYYEKRSLCIQDMAYLKKKGIKLIAISNDLSLSTNSLFFEPYSSKEMEEIVKLKIKEEIGEDIINDLAIKLISKKFNTTGDLRLLFRHIQMLIEKKIETDSYSQIKIEDSINDTESNENQINNIHHKIVKEVLAENKNLDNMNLYSKYILKCKDFEIPFYDRNDFIIILDMYK